MNDEDNFVTYGTPLEPLEEDEAPKKKPIRVEDQIVTDEKGRRRFHGAFTGGFSAGHFNTVGTVEGWAPSTFMSSRSSRGEAKQQRPEDYMDSEDLGQFGIAPRTVHTTKEFRDTQAEANKRKRPYAQPNEGPIPGISPLRDLIIPASEPMGIKLLMKMGWKPGQGIGPRVKYKQKKKGRVKVSGTKNYGCALPQESDESDDETAANFTFAPDDVDSVQYRPKDNVFGLGYSGLDKRPLLSESFSLFGSEPTRVEKKKKIGMRGQAFGVGAFEDEDEDIYHREDMANYDFTLEEPKSEAKTSKGSTPIVDHLIKMLEGFRLATKPPPPKKHYPLPLLPQHFKPFHTASTSSALARLLSAKSNKGMNRHGYTAKERGILLGEKPLPQSVFKEIPLEDRARLEQAKAAAGQVCTPPTAQLQEKKRNVPGASILSPPVISPDVLADSQKIAKSMTFKPFIKDEAKQKRYEIFLSLSKSGKKEALAAIQPTHLTEWEKVREQEEFNKAAQLYRPLAAGIASRFVSSKALEQEDGAGGLSNLRVEKEKLGQENEAESKSVQRKRERIEWHPDKLLCKRFNVPNPYPDSSEVGVRKVKRDKFSIFNFLTMGTQPATTSHASVAETSTEISSEDIPDPVAEEVEEITAAPLPQNDSITQVELTPKLDERPSMDLFKAIFQDSDDDSDNDVQEQAGPSSSGVALDKPESGGPDRSLDNYDINLEKPAALSKIPLVAEDDPLPVNRLRNSMPARGVFANLDLTQLSKPLTLKPSQSTVPPPDTASTPDVLTQDVLYGPKLPPPSNSESRNGEQIKSKSTRTSEKETKHHHKKHKEKDRHKHRKHKKHKQKSKSKHKSKESSEESNAEETTRELMERLKKLHKGIK